MLSFPRRRRGKDKRQPYSVPDITSFILLCQRDNHNSKYHPHSLYRCNKNTADSLYKQLFFILIQTYFIKSCTKTYNFFVFSTVSREVCTLFAAPIGTTVRLSAGTLLYFPQQLENAPATSDEELSHPTASAHATAHKRGRRRNAV